MDGLEKRKFQRLESPLKVTFDVVSAENYKGLPQQYCKSRNISQDGICLETKAIEVDGVNLLSGRPFARNNRLELSIELVSEEQPLLATGEVRWYDIAGDVPEFSCRLGVAFLEMNVDDKGRLAKFIKKHRQNR